MKIRLTDTQIQAIKEGFQQNFGPEDHLWLFGSRVDMNQKGGDIDLYIETLYKDFAEALPKKTRMRVYITQKLGERRIDIVVNVLALCEDKPIYKEARKTGVLLV